MVRGISPHLPEREAAKDRFSHHWMWNLKRSKRGPSPMKSDSKTKFMGLNSFSPSKEARRIVGSWLSKVQAEWAGTLLSLNHLSVVSFLHPTNTLETLLCARNGIGNHPPCPDWAHVLRVLTGKLGITSAPQGCDRWAWCAPDLHTHILAPWVCFRYLGHHFRTMHKSPCPCQDHVRSSEKCYLRSPSRAPLIAGKALSVPF